MDSIKPVASKQSFDLKTALVSFREDLKITLKRKLGGSGRVRVYECEIEGQPGTKYVTKVREIYDNIHKRN